MTVFLMELKRIEYFLVIPNKFDFQEVLFFPQMRPKKTTRVLNENEKMIFFISNTSSDGYRVHSGYNNLNANFKYLAKLGSKNKLQIIANILDSPDAMDPGGLNIVELESDRRQARARNLEYDARESVRQFKLGLNLKSAFNNFKLTNSIYYNRRLFDGKLPFRNGGIIDLDKSFLGYKLNFESENFMNYNLGFSYNNQNDHRKRFINDLGIKSDMVMNQFEKYDNIGLYFFGSKNIGKLFKDNNIQIDKVLSSEWCRCKDTARFAFNNYETFKGLNSFYQEKFYKYKEEQIKSCLLYTSPSPRDRG